jgi:dolichyl-phosphate beta-glucosyltransferase
MELSIVFPVLNEEHKITADIDAAFAFLEQNRISGEVIVVDDGSTDNTPVLSQASGKRAITPGFTELYP